MKKYIPLILIPLILTAPSIVKAEEPKTVGELRKKYEEAEKSFTEEQKAIIKALDDERMEAFGHEISMISGEARLVACEQHKPGFVESYQGAFEAYKHHQQTLANAKRKELNRKIYQLDFVKPEYVGGQFAFSDGLMRQIVSQTSEVIKQAGLKKEACDELETELVPYSKNTKSHVQDEKPIIARATFAESRDLTNGKIEVCNISWGATDDKNRRATATIVYDQLDEDKSTFSFSFKVADMKAQNYENIDYAYIDFGEFNTKDHAQTTLSKQLYLGYLKRDNIINILRDLKKKEVFSFTVHVANEPSPMIFPVGLPSAEAEKFSNCVYNLDPEYKDQLNSIGFTNLQADQKHIAAKNMPPVKYKTSSQLDNNGQRIMCAWMMDVADEKVPYKASFVRTANLNNSSPMNDKTFLWIMGVDQALDKRLNIEEGWIEVKSAQDSNTILNSQDARVAVDPGERHTSVLKEETLSNLLEGINKHGFTLKARAKGSPQIASYKIDPPNPNELAAYQNCLSELPK